MAFGGLSVNKSYLVRVGNPEDSKKVGRKKFIAHRDVKYNKKYFYVII
jgi:hypothetical protein